MSLKEEAERFRDNVKQANKTFDEIDLDGLYNYLKDDKGWFEDYTYEEHEAKMHEKGKETFFESQKRQDFRDFLAGKNWYKDGEWGFDSTEPFKENGEYFEKIKSYNDWVNSTEFDEEKGVFDQKTWGGGIAKLQDGINDIADMVKTAKDWTEGFGKMIGGMGLDNDLTKKNIEDAVTNVFGKWLGGLATNWMGPTQLTFNGDGIFTTLGKRKTAIDKVLPGAADALQTSDSIKSNMNPTDINTFQDIVSQRNKKVEEMFKQGPDLFSNSFDTFLVVETEKGFIFFSFDKLFKKGTNSEKKDAEYFINNPNEIAVRTSRISIPFKMQGTTSEKFLNQTIEMSNHSVEFENKATLSLDLDSNLSIVEIINQLAGADILYVDESLENNNISRIKSGNWIQNKGKAKLHLIVNSRSFSFGHLKYFNPNLENVTNNIIYDFEDVKFLGSDSISFSRDSFSLQTKNFDFTFKNLLQVYKMQSDIEPDNKQAKSIGSSLDYHNGQYLSNSDLNILKI